MQLRQQKRTGESGELQSGQHYCKLRMPFLYSGTNKHCPFPALEPPTSRSFSETIARLRTFVRWGPSSSTPEAMLPPAMDEHYRRLRWGSNQLSLDLSIVLEFFGHRLTTDPLIIVARDRPSKCSPCDVILMPRPNGRAMRIQVAIKPCKKWNWQLN